MDGIIAFITAHIVPLSMIGVAVIDYLIERNPSLEHNGLVSFLLSFFTGKATPTPKA